MLYQVTLMCDTCKYKPVSTIIEQNPAIYLANKAEKKNLITRGTQKICIKHSWRSADLKRLGYSKVKIREYNEAEIKAEKAENFAMNKAMKKIERERGN